MVVRPQVGFTDVTLKTARYRGKRYKGEKVGMRSEWKNGVQPKQESSCLSLITSNFVILVQYGNSQSSPALG